MAGFSYKLTGGAAGTSTRADLDVGSEVTGLTPGQSYDVMTPSGAILTVTPESALPVAGLVAAWQLADATDGMGAHNLTEVGAPTYTTGFQGDNSINISNATYVEAPDHADFSTEPAGNPTWSMCFWMKPDTYDNPGSRHYISKNTAGWTSGEWRIGGLLNTGDERLVFDLIDNSGAQADTLTILGNVLPTGLWTMVTVMVDNANNLMFATTNDNTFQSTAKTIPIYPSTNPIRFAFGHSGTYGWTGQLARAYYWNRLLTQDEVTDLYNGGTGVIMP